MSTMQTTKSAKSIKPAIVKGQAPGELAKRLEQLRDEVRLDMHLAKMDAKDRWREMQPQLHQVERLAEHLTEISFRALGQVAAEVKRFQDAIKQHRPRA